MHAAPAGWNVIILTLPRYACLQAAADGTPTPPRPATQLAWLTEDMLKASTRTGGIAARVK